MNNNAKDMLASTYMSDPGKFWGKYTRIDSGCWEWGGGLTRGGYGCFMAGRRKILTHRHSYQLSKGSIPDGMMVCHTCDNRKCGNPEHLWLGTARDNVMDAVTKGRHPKLPRRGGSSHPQAKLTDEQRQRIRDLHASGVSYPAIGRMFDVAHTTALRVVNGQVQYKCNTPRRVRHAKLMLLRRAKHKPE